MAWGTVILAAALAAAGSPPVQPLHLDVDESGNLVVIRLVGASPSSWSGRYELEVTGGPSGGSSRSMQGGTATLQPGKPVTVATVRLGNRSGEQWIAHLHVIPSVGNPYDLEWRSAR
jgi:hypothetical protein